MSKPVVLLDAGELVALAGATDGDVLTWNGTTQQWQSSPGGGVGTVTSVALSTGSTGLTVSDGTSQAITGSGTFALGGTLGAGYGGTGLGAPAVGDAGKVLTATAGGGYELATNGSGTVTSVTAGAGLSGGTITTSGTISMPNVGTAGAYGSASSVPVITTDAQGRVSGVVPTSIAIGQSAVTDLVTDLAGKVSTSTQVIAGTGLSGGGALSGNVTLSLPSVGTQGTYGSASSVAVVTTDLQGRVSAATTTAIAIGQSAVTDLVSDLAAKVPTTRTVSTTSGQLTGGGALSGDLTLGLDAVGTAQTSLGSASKTVTISTDAYGRVTALSEQAIGSLPASAISSGQLALAQGGTGLDASVVTGGQLLVGGTGALALQSVSGDGSLASSGALTVTGLQANPVAAGSLTLGDAGKALIWSGSAWQAAAIPGGGGGGGGGLTLYCNYAASSPYVLDTAFDEHANWNTGAVTVANDANGTELARFLTPTSFVVEVIPAGLWDLNLYAQASGAANDTAIRAKVGVWDGSTLTVLGTSDYTYVTDPTVLTQYKASVYVPTYDVQSGERIAVVIEGRRFAATSQTVTSYFGVGAISHVHSTLNAPGGTGLLKVVNGYLQSPASLLVNADVDAAAAIAVSKLAAAGTNDYVLTTVSGVPTWQAPAYTGTVTSVSSSTALSGLTLATTNGTTTPAIALTGTLGVGSGGTGATTLTGYVKGSGASALTASSTIPTSDLTGTLGIVNGGTGLTAAGLSGNILVSDGSALASVAMSGDATLASTGALTLKNTGTAGTYGSASAVPVFVTDQQGRVTLAVNTSIEIGTSAITSGTLGVGRGGTGASILTQYGVLVGAGTSAVQATPVGSSGQYLKSGAGAANPSFETIAVAEVTGAAPLASPTFTGTVTLPLTTAGYVTTTSGGVISSSGTVAAGDLLGQVAIVNGGTNNGSLSVAQGTIYYGDGTKLVGLAPGTSGQFLQTQGAGANPTWASAGSATTPYDLSGEFVGTPASAAVIMRFVAARAFTLAGTAYFACTTGPTSNATFTVNVNGGSKGTVTISTSATSGTGSITSTLLAAGDLVTVVATTPAAIVNPYWTLPGTV